MSNKSEFQIQWRNLCSDLNGTINDQISQMGKLDLGTLNAAYNERVRNWTSYIQVEGEWLNSIKNDGFKQDFLKEIRDFSFQLPEAQKGGDSGIFTPTVSVAGGVAVFFCLKFLLNRALLLSGLGGVAVAAAVGIGISRRSKNGRVQHWKDIGKMFSEQLTQKGEKLTSLIERAGC